MDGCGVWSSSLTSHKYIVSKQSVKADHRSTDWICRNAAESRCPHAQYARSCTSTLSLRFGTVKVLRGWIQGSSKFSGVFTWIDLENQGDFTLWLEEERQTETLRASNTTPRLSQCKQRAFFYLRLKNIPYITASPQWHTGSSNVIFWREKNSCLIHFFLTLVMQCQLIVVDTVDFWHEYIYIF